MEKGVGSIWCLVLLIPGLLPWCWSQGEMSYLSLMARTLATSPTSEGLTSYIYNYLVDCYSYTYTKHITFTQTVQEESNWTITVQKLLYSNCVQSRTNQLSH